MSTLSITHRRQARGERGATAVEFAFILPVLVMLLLGIVTAGVAFSHGIGLANAVREASRFAATADSTSLSWSADSVARVRTTQFDDDTEAALSGTAVCVQLWKYSVPGQNTGNGTSSCSASGSGGPTLTMPGKDAYPEIPALPTFGTAGTCVVRVVAARNFTISLGVFPTLSGTTIRGSVARYERAATC